MSKMTKINILIQPLVLYIVRNDLIVLQSIIVLLNYCRNSEIMHVIFDTNFYFKSRNMLDVMESPMSKVKVYGYSPFPATFQKTLETVVWRPNNEILVYYFLKR